MTRPRPWLALAIALPAALGCGNSSHPTPDARMNDAGGSDTATHEAAPPPDARVDEPTLEAAAPDVPDGDAGAATPDGAGGVDAHDAGTTVATTKPCATLATSGDVLLELGHGAGIAQLRQSGALLLSQDGTGHWVVWNTTTRAPLVSGDAPQCTIEDGPGCIAAGSTPLPGSIGAFLADLAGTTVGVGGADHVTLLSATNGQMVGSVPWSSADGPWGLATDGSYVWTITQSALTVWTPAGKKIASRNGDYLSAQLAATPQQLMIAQGPAGQGNSIERISLATGKATVGPTLNDQFWGWFLDGSGRFLTAEITAVGSTINVFAPDGTMIDHQSIAAELGQVGAQGQFFWATEGNTAFRALSVFKLGGAGVPVRTVPQIDPSLLMPSGQLLALRTSPMRVLDLSTDDAKLITTSLDGPGIFAADPSGSWAAGDFQGVVYAGGTVAAPAGAQALNCGQVKAIAGAGAGVATIATAVGQTLVVDLGAQRTLRAALALPAGRLQLSDDGTLLAAQSTALQLFDLPGLLALKSWPTVDANQRSTFIDFALAGGGARLAQTSKVNTTTGPSGSKYRRWVEGTRDDGVTVDDRFTASAALPLAPVALSPNGTMSAVCDTTIVLASSTPDAVTQIFHDDVAVASVGGYPVGWIDDQHLVLWRATRDHNGNLAYAGMVISDVHGTAGPLIPVDGTARSGRVSAAGIYDRYDNTLYSLVDGHVLWPSGAAPEPAISPAGDLAGSQVVFASGHQVRVAAY